MPLGTKVGLSPGDIVLDGAQLPLKRGAATNFRPMFIVAKRSSISAAAELVLFVIYSVSQVFVKLFAEYSSNKILG